MCSGNHPPNCDLSVRHLISAAIEKSGKERRQIALEMEDILGQHVTFRMLNDFSAECKKAARFPAAWVDAFCRVTGDDRLGRFIIGERLRSLVAFAEREIAATRDERERRAIREGLAGE